MGYPKNLDGTKIRISVNSSGVTLYGNKTAFKNLQNWISWIADSDESENYECHVVWHLGNEDALSKSMPDNISIDFDDSTRNVFDQPTKDSTGFDLTFMAVTDDEL